MSDGWGADPPCSGCTHLEQENAELREQVVTLEAALKKAEGDGAPSAVVQDLFQYWQEQTGHDRAKLDDKRARKIRDRLKDGYTAETIRQAIDGVARYPFVVDGQRAPAGRPNQRFDDVELVCRNAANLDRFAQLGAGLAETNVGSKWVGA